MFNTADSTSVFKTELTVVLKAKKYIFAVGISRVLGKFPEIHLSMSKWECV